MRDGMEPRRNWKSLRAAGIEKTRMIVPFSDAVARRVPVLLTTMQERGERCASTTLIASSLSASNRSTSPVVGGICEIPGGAWAGVANEDEIAFWGSG